ncbi:Peroxisomal membrane protein PMP27 [Coemansia javaensis]|uniref:Peroxisomal membrane protein PMP27 n=1 Tax=Coemansia javaensis TaxID=2761396 RepID=A0A9W8HC89_9FUNG|nr:Peroxisomal membrane protein PMP27 [Coemansia javaensis]
MSSAKRVVLAAANSRALDVYVGYTNLLVGRDKACRLGQYLARFLAYVVARRIARQGKTAGLVAWLATLAKVQQALGTTRKVMRAGKFVNFAQLAARAIAAAAPGDDEVAWALGLAQKLGMCVFMAADTLGLLGTTLALVRLRDPAHVARVAQRGWLCALAAQALLAVYQLRAVSIRAADLRRVRSHIEKTDDAMGDRECAIEERALAVQRAGLSRQLAAAALDLTIPLKGLGILPLNEGLVALAGTATSLMGAQDVLSKVVSA